MKHRTRNQVLLLLMAWFLLFSPQASAQAPGGYSVTDGGVSAVGEFAITTGGPNLEPGLRPPSMLARRDYQKVYEQAKALLDSGTQFRQIELQLPPACSTPAGCQLNYQNLNNGELFSSFCADYNGIDVRGYCPGDDPVIWPQPSMQIRGQLVRAREMFGFLALAEPAGIKVMVNNRPMPVREVGRAAVLTATREIANIHMIFGNEFLVDALDYRFGGGDPRADQIIAEELEQLQLARQQFELAVGVLAHAFNADFGGPNGGYIGDFFTEREFDLFGRASERMVLAIGEIADRHRQLGQDAQALELYASAFANQYVQAMALATSSFERNQNFLANGGFEVINNLERLRDQAQTIHDGINPFGFVDEYVPLQTYAELRNLTQGDFLRDATEDENRAENAQREFDQNRTALAREMQNLRLTYNTRLLELCGPNKDNYVTCDGEGGLMRQNLINLKSASARLRQVKQRQLNVEQQIAIEQERAKAVIQLTLKNGDTIAATELARGVINAVRTTDMTVSASSHEFHAGIERRISLSVGINPLDLGAKIEDTISLGYRFSDSQTSSTSTVWDPDQEELAKLNSAQALQQALIEADIIGANSEATIRTMALQLAELAIEEEIAYEEINRLAAEHNDLVNQYHHFLNLRAQAQQDVVDSNLANPAFRLLRDQTTVEAARSVDVAAQFAYLTAKALEHDFLYRYPALGDIFKARTADDVDNFLNDLEAFRLALGSPGQLNRFPYRISLAKDLLGLSDENLDPTGSLPASERSRLRLEGFQRVIQQHVITNTTTGKVVAIELPFTTALVDNHIFSPNIWNNRIAGVGLPADVPNTQGIAINLLTRQFGDISTPEVQLTQGGHSTYRTATGQVVEYEPENARLSGYVVPDGFESKTKTATILASVNGNGRGTPSSALFNRSVAASGWVIRIDLRSPFNSKLDISQLEDIEINMDTTGIALPNRTREAQVDGERLQVEFQQEIRD